MTVALVNTSGNKSIVQTWPSVPNPLPLPNGDRVAGAAVGWTSADGTYELVAVSDPGAPTGVNVTGSSVEIVEGVPTVVYATTPLTAAQAAEVAYATAFAAGIAVTCTSTPALNGTYAIDPAAQANVAAVIDYMTVNGSFPDAQVEMPVADLSGAVHLFPTMALYKEWATAVANYVAAWDIWLEQMLAGGSPAQPTNGVTIA